MRKKKFLIIVPIVVIIIVAAVIAVLYFTTDLFKPTNDLFWKYFAQNQDIISILANDNNAIQSQFKQNNTYTSSGNLSFVMEQGENSSKQFTVETTSRHDVNTGRTYADATLKNGDIDLFQVSYINSEDIYAIKCDEVFANYVGIRNSGLKELATNYGIENVNNIPDSFNVNDFINAMEITEAQKQHILDTYLPIIQNRILEEQYTKTNEQIQIEGNSYSANVYTVQLTGENAKQIIIDCLNTLKSDTETLVLISNKLSTIGFGIEYTDITNLTTRIDEMLQQIGQLSMENPVRISIYEADRETIRTVFAIENSISITYDRTETVSALTIEGTQMSDYLSLNANGESGASNIITGDSNGENVDESENVNTIAADSNENQGANEIIDLTSQENMDTSITSQLIIRKSKNNNLTTNTVQIIPDIADSNTNIQLEWNKSNVQNDTISNSYLITLNTNTNENTETITISYNNTIAKVDQVEEIQELTNANTAIANNYSAEEFTNFINSWSTIFSQRLTEKMALLGFEI